MELKRIFSLKSPPVMGIDISTTAVKLLELSRSSSGYRVESYAMEPLIEKIIEDKSINSNNEEAIDIVGQAITRAVKQAKPKAQHAAVAVAGPTVITKVVTMDASMSDNDKKEVIEGESESYIGKPLEEVNFDFEVIGKNEKEETRVDVLLAAADKKNIDNIIAALEVGGVKARIVDIEKYVLEKAFKLVAHDDPEINEEDTIALVEIGATTTVLNVMGDKKIVFTREELFGGKRLTEEIQSHYGMSYEEASVAKRTGALPENYETDLLEPFKVEMAQQISRMVQYYYSMEASSKYGQLSHILLAGGCATIPGIKELVTNKVGGNVSIANPFIAMSVASGVNKKELINDAPALMIACGLALRNFDER